MHAVCLHGVPLSLLRYVCNMHRHDDSWCYIGMFDICILAAAVVCRFELVLLPCQPWLDRQAACFDVIPQLHIAAVD